MIAVAGSAQIGSLSTSDADSAKPNNLLENEKIRKRHLPATAFDHQPRFCAKKSQLVCRGRKAAGWEPCQHTKMARLPRTSCHASRMLFPSGSARIIRNLNFACEHQHLLPRSLILFLSSLVHAIACKVMQSANTSTAAQASVRIGC